MQPSDTTPTPTPEPPKQSFWSKLLGKKPAPVVPQHESLAPPPQLDENTPESTPPAVSLQPAPPQTDSIIGTPEAKDLSAPDQNGEVTSLPIDVPSSVESPVKEDTAPTIKFDEPVAQQTPTVEQPATPQPVAPVPLAEPTPPVSTPLPPVEPQLPVQPPHTDQQ